MGLGPFWIYQLGDGNMARLRGIILAPSKGLTRSEQFKNTWENNGGKTSSEIQWRVFGWVCLRFHLHSKIIEQKESMLLCSATAPSNLLPSAMSHITQSAHKQRMAEPHVVATQKKKNVPSSLPSAAFTDQLRWKYSSWWDESIAAGNSCL